MSSNQLWTSGSWITWRHNSSFTCSDEQVRRLGTGGRVRAGKVAETGRNGHAVNGRRQTVGTRTRAVGVRKVQSARAQVARVQQAAAQRRQRQLGWNSATKSSFVKEENAPWNTPPETWFGIELCDANVSLKEIQIRFHFSTRFSLQDPILLSKNLFLIVFDVKTWIITSKQQTTLWVELEVMKFYRVFLKFLLPTVKS